MTGRIEGLYFDPGSQPYQELKLWPEGTAGPGYRAGPDSIDRTGDEDHDGPTNRSGDKDVGVDVDNDRLSRTDGPGSTSEQVGLKKWFPSVEFR